MEAEQGLQSKSQPETKPATASWSELNMNIYLKSQLSQNLELKPQSILLASSSLPSSLFPSGYITPTYVK